ncbi:Crp/Fnr family transcriptional regulator [Variovorax sp. M-6]|uniref:Crp/Fnr family transcriptional regulator n=1 Tax=Variovorax sp. M-6 TaxID=3233041 RepID=UPI003F98F385
MHTVPVPDVQSCIAAHPTRLAGIERSEHAALHEMLDLLGVPIGEGQQPPDTPLTVRRLRAGGSLFFEGAPATSIYVVRAGTFKAFHTAQDGYEQVIGFARRGDLLGCDALSGDCHLMAAVALEDASVYAIALPDFYALAQSLPAFYRGVMRAVGSAMHDLTQLADMMAAVAAEVRLARFLMHLSQRMATSGQSARSLRLLMTRRDIGSYLGVAHETISRSFAALAALRLVKVEQRRVEILDFGALQRFAQGTRAPAKARTHGFGLEACAA